jgi:hypothetical protein
VKRSFNVGVKIWELFNRRCGGTNIDSGQVLVEGQFKFANKMAGAIKLESFLSSRGSRNIANGTLYQHNLGSGCDGRHKTGRYDVSSQIQPRR